MGAIDRFLRRGRRGDDYKPMIKRLEAAMLAAVRAAGGSAWYVPDDFLVLGPELVVNGKFDGGLTGWVNTNAVASVVSDQGGNVLSLSQASGSANLGQAISLDAGKAYQISFKRRGIAVGSGLSGRISFIYSDASSSQTPTASVTVRSDYESVVDVLVPAKPITVFRLIATTSSADNVGLVYFDDISIREILSAKDFQDSAGTLPSYLGGTVGLGFDVAGLVGQEKNTLPLSAWTLPAGFAADGSTIVCTSASTSLSCYGTLGLASGKAHLITYTISDYASGSIRPIASSGVVGAIRSANGTYTEIITPSTAAGNFGFQPWTTNFTGKITVVSVREISGNHVTQATAGNRPTITRIPRKLGPEKAQAANYVVGVGGYDNTLYGVSASGFTAVAGTTASRVALNFATEIGKTYNISFRMTAGAASGTVVAYSRDMASGGGASLSSTGTITAGAIYNLQFTATSTSSSALWVSSVAAQSFSVDSISVREVLEWSYALTFDGSNDALGAPASVIGSNLSQPYTMISWGKVGPTGLARSMFGDGLRGVGVNSSGRPRVTHTGPGVKDGVTTLAQGQSVIIESTWDGSNVSVYLNGTLETSSAFAGPSGTLYPTALGQFGSAASYWNAEIGGCVVCPAVMTDAQRLAVRKFAAAQMGLSL